MNAQSGAARQDSEYPSLSARIDRIKFLAVSTTPDDQRQVVIDFVEEYDLIASYLVRFVKGILGALIPGPNLD